LGFYLILLFYPRGCEHNKKKKILITIEAYTGLKRRDFLTVRNVGGAFGGGEAKRRCLIINGII
jgi:hypothetical protein